MADVRRHPQARAVAEALPESCAYDPTVVPPEWIKEAEQSRERLRAGLETSTPWEVVVDRVWRRVTGEEHD